MNSFTGWVNEYDGHFYFDNDDGTDRQRLTRADWDGDYSGETIDLAPFAGQFISVNGQWEHEWIICAEILNEKSGNDS